MPSPTRDQDRACHQSCGRLLPRPTSPTGTRHQCGDGHDDPRSAREDSRQHAGCPRSFQTCGGAAAEAPHQELHCRRLRIEHVNSSVKRCRIVKDRIRLWKEGVRDVVMELCCALHNFRVRLTPWQPMV